MTSSTPRPITVLDVARHAGVSVGTVSSVLNRPDSVGEARRARVHAAIEVLGFVPNRTAQALRNGRSRLVGVCLPHVSSAYFSSLLANLETVASRRAFGLVQVLSHRSPAVELERITALLTYQVAGLLIVPTMHPAATLDLVARARLPTVVLDRPSRDQRFDAVTFDNAAAIRQIAERLIALGHRRVLFVASFPGLSTTKQRIAALRTAFGDGAAMLRQAGDPARFDAALAALLSGAGAPTAVIASNTTAGVWTVRALRRAGLRWPGDVSLLLLDHPDWADIMDPPLAVLQTPALGMAEAAWALLLDRPSDAPGRQVVSLQAAMLWRDSVAPPLPPSLERQALAVG